MTLKTQRLQTLEQIRAFLEGSQSFGFGTPARASTYNWIADKLRRFIKQFRDIGRITDRCGPPTKPFSFR